MPSTQRTKPSVRGPVVRISPHDNHTVLTFDCCCGEQQVSVDTVPNLEKARFWGTTPRRMLRAALRIDADRVNCKVQGLGHRRPVSRRIPLAAALGLGMLGNPLFVVADEH